MPILTLEEARGNPRAVQVRIATATASRVGAQRAHDLRLGPQPGYVDRDRSHLNRVLIAPETGAGLRAICEDRRAARATRRAMKSNAAVGVSGIVTFGHMAQGTFGALTADQQDLAYRDVIERVAERLGTTLTGLVVHADESAPHAHFQLAAYRRDGMPVSSVAKRAVLRDLQTIAAAVMGNHAPGIERGYSKIGRLQAGASPAEVVHWSVAELHDRLPEEIATLRARIEGLQGQLAASEEKAATNERRAEAARRKAEGDEARAEKALKNAAIYERRLDAARAEGDRLRGEVAAAEARVEAAERARAEMEAARAAAEAERGAAAREKVAAEEAQGRLDRERAAFEREADGKAVELAQLEGELDAAIADHMAGTLDLDAEVERRTEAERRRLDRERDALRPTLRAEVEHEMATARAALDREAKAQRAERDRLGRVQEALEAGRAALREAEGELRRRREALAEDARRVVADARAIADVAVRAVAGVLTGATRSRGPDDFDVPEADRAVLDRHGLAPVLAGAVERVARFWADARGQLDAHRQDEAREAATRAIRTPGMEGPSR